MKIHLLVFIYLVSITISNGQGWRDAEKQIIVTINNAEEAASLASLKLSCDIISENQIRAYVVPKEMAQIELMDLSYEIEVEDLNKPDPNFYSKDAAYHSYQEIIDLADSLELNFPNICKKYIFGTSLGGRQLAALKISDNVEMDEAEAKLLFDGGIHGDEICGPENIIRFARDICIAYGSDPDVTYLIDNRETWFYLMVNPDGREAVPRVRYNNNGVDLNRDWGYMWNGEGNSTGAYSQVETKALRSCMYNNPFVIHTSYHGGTEYISHPWSYRSSQPNDYDHLNFLAGIYSSVSGYPNLTYGQGNTGMYPINGSTKDSNYGIMGSITWSMEISNEKQPPTSELMMYYNRNYPSMLAMMEYAGYGLEGIVTDANTGEPVQAVVFVDDFYLTYTDPEVGDYHKFVLPGTYDITVVANGYESMTIENVVVAENYASTTNFELQPEDVHFAYKFAASRIPNNNDADEGYTPAVIGTRDYNYYSIGKSGWCIIDMQYPIIDIPGNDFIVYEGDEIPEIYLCYIGETIDGPWLPLGAGNGTSVFDISATGLSEIQFIKIMDDGNGFANVPNAGFDLDAIEAIETDVFLTLVNYTINDSSGNSNGKIDPGEFVELNVTIKNNGYFLAENFQGEISCPSQYLYLMDDTASFGNIAQGQTATGTFEIVAHPNTSHGMPVNITLEVSSNDSSYHKSHNLSFIIGQPPITIIDLDLNYNSAPKIKTALESIGVYFESLTDFPVSMNAFSTIFVCLGVYNDNYSLSINDGQMLANFLNNGGNLYLEGGETWAYDTQTAVHPMFNITGESDGLNDLSTIHGQAETFTDGMSFLYDGDNILIDHISPVSPAVLILENQSPIYGTGVAYDAGTYKTIGVSHEFGGLVDENSSTTKQELLKEYLRFFNVELPIFTAFTASNTVICEQETINFTDLSDGNVTSWEWIFEEGTPLSSNSQNPIITYYNAGSFDVTLTISDGVETQTLTLEDYITVMPIPETPTIPDGPVNVNSFPGDISVYSTIVTDSTDIYTWVLEPEIAGELIQNGAECSVDWEDYWVGDANLKVMATNNCGDSEFSEGLQIFCNMTNISHQFRNDIFIVPNPSKGTFSIHLDDYQMVNTELRIMNNLGNLIYQNNNPNTENGLLNLHLVDIESGIYYLILKSDTYIIKEKIIIK